VSVYAVQFGESEALYSHVEPLSPERWIHMPVSLFAVSVHVTRSPSLTDVTPTLVGAPGCAGRFGAVPLWAFAGEPNALRSGPASAATDSRT